MSRDASILAERREIFPLNWVSTMKTSRIRRAFTLIELLVVIAIISVLIALFCRPCSLQERRRRVQCVNNLKQIGLALHNYLSAVGVLPPGRFNSHISARQLLGDLFTLLPLDQAGSHGAFRPTGRSSRIRK